MPGFQQLREITNDKLFGIVYNELYILFLHYSMLHKYRALFAQYHKFT